MAHALMGLDDSIRGQSQSHQIRIGAIQEEDIEEILNFLKIYFFRDEPMNKYLKLDDSEELYEGVIKSISEKCSFKAMNSCGEIIGVAINGIIEKPDPKQTSHSAVTDCKNPQFKKILALFEYIDHQFNIFNIHPRIQKYLDLAILSVNVNYRGCGVAGKLIEKTIDYTRENKIALIKVLCSSYYSARVCEKMGFKKVYDLQYIDYKVDGINPILPEAPHKAVQILLQDF